MRTRSFARSASACSPSGNKARSTSRLPSRRSRGRDGGDTESKVRRCGIVGRGSCFIAARLTNCSLLTREVLMDGCFSQDYVEAREKFAAAARAAGAEPTAFALDKQGPDGGALSTDVAWLGPSEAQPGLGDNSDQHRDVGVLCSATRIQRLR